MPKISVLDNEDYTAIWVDQKQVWYNNTNLQEILHVLSQYFEKTEVVRLGSDISSGGIDWDDFDSVTLDVAVKKLASLRVDKLQSELSQLETRAIRVRAEIEANQKILGPADEVPF